MAYIFHLREGLNMKYWLAVGKIRWFTKKKHKYKGKRWEKGKIFTVLKGENIIFFKYSIFANIHPCDQVLAEEVRWDKGGPGVEVGVHQSADGGGLRGRRPLQTSSTGRHATENSRSGILCVCWPWNTGLTLKCSF